MKNIVNTPMAINRLHSGVWERVASYYGGDCSLGPGRWFMMCVVRMFYDSRNNRTQISDKMGDAGDFL